MGILEVDSYDDPERKLRGGWVGVTSFCANDITARNAEADGRSENAFRFKLCYNAQVGNTEETADLCALDAVSCVSKKGEGVYGHVDDGNEWFRCASFNDLLDACKRIH